MQEDQASFYEDLSTRFYGRYTGVGGIVSLVSIANLAKTGILRRTANVIEIIQDEVGNVVSEQLQGTKDWKPFKVSRLALDMTARVTSMVFVGPRLCRNSEWVRELVQRISISCQI